MSRNEDKPQGHAGGEESGMRRGLTSYGDAGFSLFLRKAFIKGAGYSDAALERPVIGITDTGSGYNPCHGNMPQLVEAVQRGIMLAGGLPVKFPTISLHESFSHPTSMYLRNLMSIDTEEMIRAQPMDAVVLIGGCDKTVPAQLMGAASAGIPAVQLITGSMLTGSHRGERVGASGVPCPPGPTAGGGWVQARIAAAIGGASVRARSMTTKSPASTTSWCPAWEPAR